MIKRLKKQIATIAVVASSAFGMVTPVHAAGPMDRFWFGVHGPDPLSDGSFYARTVVVPHCAGLPALTCVMCVETFCTAGAVDQEAIFLEDCMWVGHSSCPDFVEEPVPPPSPVTEPDPKFVPVPVTPAVVAIATGAAVVTVGVVVTKAPAIGSALGTLLGGARLGPVGIVFALPIVLAATGGQAFANYVDNYQIGIDNGINGAGPTGTGQCPPGQSPVTYAYGTTCVPDPQPMPTPNCSEIHDCESIAASEGGIVLEDGAFGAVCDEGVQYLVPGEIECLQNGALTSVEGCFKIGCVLAP